MRTWSACWTLSGRCHRGVKPTVDWRTQNVLVTGAGGFIGSHLIERLVDLGARTRGLVRYNSRNSWGWLDNSPAKGDVEVVYGDICDRDSLRPAIKGVDLIFHLAALIAIPYSYQAPLSYVRTNVEGTVNLLQAAIDDGVKLVVHTSTSEVYGSARSVPMDENHPLQGQSPYAASKIGADQIAESFHRSFGLPIAIVRPFNTFGPRQSARAIIPTIVTQALEQDEIRLGNLSPTRDFTYVNDTVEGFIKVAEAPEASGRTVNLGSGRETSIEALAAAVQALIGGNVPIIRDDRRARPESSEVDRLCADTTRAQEMFGWQPQYTLEDGLGRTIQWIEENLGRYRVGAYVL